MTLDIVNESGLPVALERTENLVRHVLAELFVHPQAELSVLYVDEAHMTALHVQWMAEPGPTDVLSFPMDELRPGTSQSPSGPGALGDIVICPKVAIAQAADAGRDSQREHDVLLAHGLLHLLGFDHVEPDEERVMFALQEKLVTSFESAAT